MKLSLRAQTAVLVLISAASAFATPDYLCRIEVARQSQIPFSTATPQTPLRLHLRWTVSEVDEFGIESTISAIKPLRIRVTGQIASTPPLPIFMGERVEDPSREYPIGVSTDFELEDDDTVDFTPLVLYGEDGYDDEDEKQEAKKLVPLATLQLFVDTTGEASRSAYLIVQSLKDPTRRERREIPMGDLIAGYPIPIQVSLPTRRSSELDQAIAGISRTMRLNERLPRVVVPRVNEILVKDEDQSTFFERNKAPLVRPKEVVRYETDWQMISPKRLGEIFGNVNFAGPLESLTRVLSYVGPSESERTHTPVVAHLWNASASDNARDVQVFVIEVHNLTTGHTVSIPFVATERIGG